MTRTTLEELSALIDDIDGVAFGKLPALLDEIGVYCNRAIRERAELLNDLDRACAVITDFCGHGKKRPPESAEVLAEWAEEFSDRYDPPPNRPMLKAVPL